MKKIEVIVLLFSLLMLYSCEKQGQMEKDDPYKGKLIDGKFVLGTFYDGIFICNHDGSAQKKIFSADTLFAYNFVQWFPKKDKILFKAENRSTFMSYILIMNADGSDLKCLSKGFWDNYPVLSPDGTKIVANITDKGVCILDLEGSILTILTSEYGDKASWSPDNKYIIFSAGQYKNEIKVHNSNGSEIISTYKQNGLRSFQWSPDSKKIIAINYWGDKGDICIFNFQSLIDDKLLNDSNLIVLTHTREENKPCFSPDGSKITFESRRDDNEEIYVMDVDGRNQKRLLITSEFEYQPSWSSDGSKIFFYKSGNSSYNIFSINLYGSEVNQISNNIPSYISSYDCDL